jgi:site-specific DNA-methyltransferase (adenine-specific)
VSKAIDDAAGAEREVVGSYSDNGRKCPKHQSTHGKWEGDPIVHVTAPATAQAAAWQGWGTALKPAHEPIVIARKPLAGTVAANVLEHGTGALNIDACRVATDDELNGGAYCGKGDRDTLFGLGNTGKTFENPSGRWPSNVIFEHAAGCRRVGSKKVAGIANARSVSQPATNVYEGGYRGDVAAFHYTDPDGTETIPAYECTSDCPVAMLDAQAGNRVSGARAAGVRAGMGYHGADGDGGPAIESSQGSASRFFHCLEPTFDPIIYQAKPSREEREAGCERLPARTRGDVTGREEDIAGQNNPRAGVCRKGEIRNWHPTVKSVALMKLLVRLVTPPGGIVLDPFAGSGSTGCACVAQGFRFIGCELEADHVAIADARIAWWQEHPGGPTPEAKEEAKLERKGQLPLLGVP